MSDDQQELDAAAARERTIGAVARIEAKLDRLLDVAQALNERLDRMEQEGPPPAAPRQAARPARGGFLSRAAWAVAGEALQSIVPPVPEPRPPRPPGSVIPFPGPAES